MRQLTPQAAPRRAPDGCRVLPPWGDLLLRPVLRPPLRLPPNPQPLNTPTTIAMALSAMGPTTPPPCHPVLHFPVERIVNNSQSNESFKCFWNLVHSKALGVLHGFEKVPEEGGCFLNEARSHIFLLQVAPGGNIPIEPHGSPNFFPHHFQDLFPFRNDLELTSGWLMSSSFFFPRNLPPLTVCHMVYTDIFFSCAFVQRAEVTGTNPFSIACHHPSPLRPGGAPTGIHRDTCVYCGAGRR